MIKSQKQMFIVIGVFIVLLMLTTVTYAFFNYTRTGIANRIQVGRIYFNSEQGNAINLTNVFPIDESEASAENDNVGSVTIHITGDTTYTEGIEYLVSAVDVNNTIGEGNNAKTIPISVSVDYEEIENKTIGTEDTNYFDNRGGNTSLYKILNKRPIGDDSKLVVGYIKPDASGIDGTITINAYLDKNKIAISDTYPERTYTEYFGEDTYEVNPNMTVGELNACKTYFASEVVTIIVNPNPTVAEINECVSYFRDTGMDNHIQSGETIETFCDGTGTFQGITLQQFVDNDYFTFQMVDDLIDMNILIIQANQANDQILEYFCNGTGEINGTTFQDRLDNGYFSSSQLTQLKNNHIINQLTYQTINGWTDGTTSSWVNGRTVLTTEEWNSLQNTNISFKIKVEANEGVWVPIQGNAMNTFPNNIVNKKSMVKEVYFNQMESDAMHQAYEAATIKADLTYNNEGEVLAWLEENGTYDTYENPYYNLYIVSDGETYLTTGASLLSNFLVMDKIEFNNINTSRVTDMSFMFGYAYKLKSIDLSSFDTSNVTNMAQMFWYTQLTSLDVHFLNMENVENLVNFASHSSTLESINMSGMNLNKVKYMAQMFYQNRNMTEVDFTGTTTRDLINTSEMFYDCSSLEYLSLSGFGGNAFEMSSSTFNGCTSLKELDMSYFNFGVSNMSGAFIDLSSQLETIDLSYINISNISNINSMFYNLSKLKTIYVSENWSIDDNMVSSVMFMGCLSLVGGNGTVYDSSNIDINYAKIDDPNSNNPGYFTDVAYKPTV